MEAYAEFYFSVTKPLKDGTTKLDHLLNAYKQTGVEPEVLKNAPQLPPDLWVIWDTFLEISSGREEGMNGPTSLTWSTLDSYCRLSQVVLSPYQLKLIKRLDYLWLRELRKES